MSIQRFIEKIILTFEHAVFLWKSDSCFDWDYNYLIKIIDYKIQRMYKFNSGKNACAYHSKKELNRMLEVLEHFKRFYDMDKYNPYQGEKIKMPDNVDDWFIPSEREGFSKINPKYEISDKELKHLIRNDNIQIWHLQEAFRKIGKYIRRWWD